MEAARHWNFEVCVLSRVSDGTLLATDASRWLAEPKTSSCGAAADQAITNSAVRVQARERHRRGRRVQRRRLRLPEEQELRLHHRHDRRGRRRRLRPEPGPQRRLVDQRADRSLPKQ